MEANVSANDPILAFGSMLMAIKLAHLGDDLDRDVAALEVRARATREHDAAAWAAIYRDALALVPRARAAHAAAEKKGKEDGAAQAERKLVQAAALAVSGVLQRVGAEYQGRLQAQEQELIEKAERSTKNLPIVSSDDPATGETTFTVAPNDLAAFWGWLRSAEETWRAHNENLVADRANEAIQVHTAELSTVRFTVTAPRLSVREAAMPKLKGHSVPTPGKLEALTRTWRVATTAVTSLGIVVTLIITFGRSPADGASVDVVKAAVVGAIFVIVLLVAAFVIIPKERRQQRNRMLAKATDAVHKETLEAVKARLKESSDTQLRTIRNHLANEAERWKAVARRVETGQIPAVAMPSGLSAENRAKLEGEWSRALEARLAELTASSTPVASG